jgi:hypothetical protein
MPALAARSGVQGTYSGVDKAFLLDNTDLRFTTSLSIADTPLRFGTSINNGPTVQDPFNSTPVWIFPFASSALAPTPTGQTLLGGRQLVGNSLGITANGWYDRSLYLEAGGYETYGPTLLSWTDNALGPGNIAPYVRAAYQWMWNNQAAHVGALLLSANINPAISPFSADGSVGKNYYTDYGVDAGYQFLVDPNIVTAYVLYVHEDQDLKGSSAPVSLANPATP